MTKETWNKYTIQQLEKIVATSKELERTDLMAIISVLISRAKKLETSLQRF